MDDDLCVIAESLGELASGTRWFVFGSSARNSSRPHDYDLLVVFPDGQMRRAMSLIEQLEAEALGDALDLVVLSESEEAEVAFVRTEGGRLVWPAQSAR